MTAAVKKSQRKMSNREIQNALQILNGRNLLVGGNVVQEAGVLDWPISPPVAFRLAQTADALRGTNEPFNLTIKKLREQHMIDVVEEDPPDGAEPKTNKEFRDDKAEEEFNDGVEALHEEQVSLSVYLIPATELVAAYRRLMVTGMLRDVANRLVALKAKRGGKKEEEPEDSLEAVLGDARAVLQVKERRAEGDSEYIPSRALQGLGPILKMDLGEEEEA